MVKQPAPGTIFRHACPILRTHTTTLYKGKRGIHQTNYRILRLTRMLHGRSKKPERKRKVKNRVQSMSLLTLSGSSEILLCLQHSTTAVGSWLATVEYDSASLKIDVWWLRDDGCGTSSLVGELAEKARVNSLTLLAACQLLSLQLNSSSSLCWKFI